MRLIVLLSLLVPFSVLAHEAGDWVVRAGPAMVDPHDSSDVIDVAGLTTLPGATVKDNTQLGMTATYMLSSNLGVELLAATPFEHDIFVKGVGIKAGKTKHLPPTVSLQYYFGDSGSEFRPYVSAGINTTIFFSEKVDPALNSALDGIVGLPAGSVQAGLSLDQSWGLSFQAGFDYMLDDNWLINGSIWYADIDTDATISTAIADVKFGVDIDPIVYMLSVGYRF